MKKILLAFLLISSLAYGQSTTLRYLVPGTTTWITQTVSDSTGIGSAAKVATSSYIASGTDTYTCTVPYFTAYTAGQKYTLLFTNQNTGASTINLNGL